MTEENILAHYGVKGMKWGRRRSRSQIDANSSEDAKTAAAASAKVKSSGTNSLSNKELQGLITRKNLEKQYKTLSGNKGAAQRGADLLKWAVSKNGKRTLSTVGSAAATVGAAGTVAILKKTGYPFG